MTHKKDAPFWSQPSSFVFRVDIVVLWGQLCDGFPHRNFHRHFRRIFPRVPRVPEQEIQPPFKSEAKAIIRKDDLSTTRFAKIKLWPIRLFIIWINPMKPSLSFSISFKNDAKMLTSIYQTENLTSLSHEKATTKRKAKTLKFIFESAQFRLVLFILLGSLESNWQRLWQEKTIRSNYVEEIF